MIILSIRARRPAAEKEHHRKHLCTLCCHAWIATCMRYRVLRCYLQRFKGAKPPHSLKKSRVLRPNLNRISVVNPHPKPMRHPAVQGRLVRGADIQQKRLQVRTEVRRHQAVTICKSYPSAHSLRFSSYNSHNNKGCEKKLTSRSHRNRRPNSTDVRVGPRRRVRRERHVGLERPRRVDEAE